MSSIMIFLAKLSSTLLPIVIGILGINFLVGFHELGHFLFCKLFGIRTPSFSIGIGGPKIFSKKMGETEFIISSIPLGGYVEISGVAEVGQGEQIDAYSTEKNSFRTKPYYQKLLVLLGGILFNMGFAYISLSLLFFTGAPSSPLLYRHGATTVIKTLDPESPAGKSGLQAGDTINSINGLSVKNNIQLLSDTIRKTPGATVQIMIERNGIEQGVDVVIGTRVVGQQSEGYLGISDFLIPHYGLVESIIKGVATTHDLCFHVIGAFKTIFKDRDMSQIGGPLMVISQTIKGAEKGFKIFLLLLSFISVNLAIINLIPLPIMDGGQILFYSIEALIRRPLPDYIREYIHMITWVLILLLVAVLSFKDIVRIFFS
jgi:regulator of sigma E protease